MYQEQQETVSAPGNAERGHDQEVSTLGDVWLPLELIHLTDGAEGGR